LRRDRVAKRDSIVDVKLLEHAVRDDLNWRAPRVCRAGPLAVVIENYRRGIEEFPCR
jgi:glutaminyl-tRNA synthetase